MKQGVELIDELSRLILITSILVMISLLGTIH